MPTAIAVRSLMIAKCRNGHTVKGEFKDCQSGIYLVCACGSRGVAKSMTIKVKADKECSGVCMGAQGPSCTCSCGGENHGASHTAAAR